MLEGLKQPETLRTFFAAAPLFSISSATAQGPNRFIPKYAPYGASGNLSVGKTLAQCLLMKMAASSATFFSVTIGNDTAEIALEGRLRRPKYPLASIERLGHLRQSIKPLIRKHASLKTPVPVP